MRALRFLLPAAFAVFVVLLWAVRDARPVMDDYVFFALGHLLHDPLPLATQDAVGSFFYRPLGLLAWWVTIHAFGTAAWPQYAFTLAVHALNGLLIAAVLRRLGAGPIAAAIAGLFFVAHPTAYSGIIWLCDRFDLLATTFGLAALWATAVHGSRGGRGAFAAAIAAVAASLLAKEVGVAYAAGAFALAVLGNPAGATPPARRERYRLAVSIAATTFAFIGLRALIVRGASQGLLFEKGFFGPILAGSLKWLSFYPRFLVPAKGSLIAIAAWLVALAAIAAGFALASRRARPPRALVHGAIAGIVLAAIAAAAQSPVVNAILFEPPRLARFDFIAHAASRFFYTPLAGTILILGAMLDLALQPGAPRRALVLAACAAGFAGLMWGSVAVGRAWSAYTIESSDRFAVAARAAAERIAVKPGCHLYFLGTPPQAEPFRQFSHMAVLYPLPRANPLWRCLVLTEHAPWYNLVVADAPAEPGTRSGALAGITIGGKPFPPLRVGPLEYRYLKVASDAAVRSDPEATFFAWDGRRFVEAGARVRAGEFRFFDNRPPA